MKKPAILKLIPLFLFLFLLASPVYAGPEGRQWRKVLSHDIKISINLKDRTVSGKDTLELAKNTGQVRLILRNGSRIEKIEADGRNLSFEQKPIQDGKFNEITFNSPEGSPAVTVSFQGSFNTIDSARDRIKRGVAFVEDGVIGEEGAFLPSNSFWYPQEEDGLPLVDATVEVPSGYLTVSEGDWVSSETSGTKQTDRWRSGKPIDGLDIVTARFHVEKTEHRGIRIYTFFFQKDEALSSTYMKKTKEYLDLYQDLIGPYPFSKFATVENFLPTGYGMPSFTLLGSSVIRLPFIPDTSLGHEIAHNWWGNSVFMDASLGNWSEAITTYTSDYLYAKKDKRQEATDFRLKQLKGYRNFAGERGITLREFTDATTTESRVVGYNKGVMVFNMLNRILGDDVFKKGLREFYSSFAFKRASWAGIRSSFEKASGQDLKWFFDQWLTRSGGPSLAIDSALTSKSGYGWKVNLRLKQKTPPYRLLLPLLFTTEGGDIWKGVWIENETGELSFDLPSRPLSVEIDPEYQVFRILSPEEVPPSFSAFFGDKTGVIIIPNRGALQEKYLRAADTLSSDYGLNMVTDADIGRKDYLMGKSIFVFGGPGENNLFWFLERYVAKAVNLEAGKYTIEGKTYSLEDTILAMAMKNPHEPEKTICFLMGNADRDRILETTKRVRYFGEFSYLVFKQDGSVVKGASSGKKVLKYEFRQ